MKRIASLVLLLTSLLAAGSALAEFSPNSRIYVGGGLGLTDTGWGPSGYDSKGFGFDVRAGFQFNRIWAVEGGFTHFADATNGPTEAISTNAISIAGRASLPIGNSPFRAYTRLGFANTFNSGGVDHSHFGLLMGYGIEYMASNSLKLDAGYSFFQGKYDSDSLVPNADYYSLNITYFLPQQLFD